jgi:hypothetical protein
MEMKTERKMAIPPMDGFTFWFHRFSVLFFPRMPRVFENSKSTRMKIMVATSVPVKNNASFK